MARSVNGNGTRAAVKLADARQRKGMILCMMFDWIMKSWGRAWPGCFRGW